MDKKTRFVKSEEAKADVVEQTQKLAPYTNQCRFSVKLGEKPTQKPVNGYQLVSFSACHWQPKGKPVMWMQCLVYDERVQQTAMLLTQGQSIVISGKLGYDVHNGVAKLFLFVDTIEV
jgi:hypothetical protein